MNDLQSLLNRNPIGICPVDDSPEALEALKNVKGQLRPLVTLVNEKGEILSASFEGTQPTLTLHETPQTEVAMGVRWLW